MFVASVAGVMALCVAAALVAGQAAWRRSAAAICLVAAFAIAFQRGLSPVTREVLTFAGLVGVLKCTQIATSNPAQWTPGKRVWSAFVFFDVRRARPVRDAWDVAMLWKVALYPVLLVASVWVPLHSSVSGPVAWALEMACGLVFAYVLLDFAVQCLRLAHRLVGLDIGELHRDPILARSLTEFWSERWNLPVTDWLHEFFFRPWSRGGHPLAGLAAAFAASAALHFWLFYAAANLQAGLMGLAFFLVQVPALILERRWRVRRWPQWAARTWTIGFVLAASPLLIIPMKIGLEMQLRHPR